MEKQTNSKVNLIFYWLTLILIIILGILVYNKSPYHLLKIHSMQGTTVKPEDITLKIEGKRLLVGNNKSSHDYSWEIINKYSVCNATTLDDRIITVYRNSKGCNEIIAYSTITKAVINTKTANFSNEVDFRKQSEYLVIFDKNNLEIVNPDLITQSKYQAKKDILDNSYQCSLKDVLVSTKSTAILEKCKNSYKLSIIETSPKKAEQPKLLKTQFLNDEYGIKLISLTPQKLTIIVKSNGLPRYSTITYS